MSISGISFWQSDRNWYIQQRVRSLSTQVPGPAVPLVDQSSHAAREAEQAAALDGGNELKSAAISALELSSSAGFTTGLSSGPATSGPPKPGSLIDRLISNR